MELRSLIRLNRKICSRGKDRFNVTVVIISSDLNLKSCPIQSGTFLHRRSSSLKCQGLVISSSSLKCQGLVISSSSTCQGLVIFSSSLKSQGLVISTSSLKCQGLVISSSRLKCQDMVMSNCFWIRKRKPPYIKKNKLKIINFKSEVD